VNTSLKAIFGLDATGLKTELKQIGAQIQRIANLWGKFALAAGAAAFAAAARGALQLGAQLDATSQKLGITTDLIQTLGFAGEQFGIRQETTNMALQRFTRRLGEAQQGGGELLPILQQYGVALTDANGRARNATAVLGDYAEILRRTANPQERLRLAFKAFDSEGVGLVNVLQDGTKGLAAFQEQATQAGAILETKTIAKLAEAENAIKNFKRRITVAVGEIIVNFRTEEGIKLLGLQLAGAAATFSAKILDAITYPARVGYAVFTAAFDAVTANLRNGLIKALQFVSLGLNKILPDKFQISIAGLERLKATGTDVAAAITRAIADTNPATFSEVTRAAYDDLIAGQKQIIADLEAANLKQPAAQLHDALATGGATAAEEIKDAATELEQAGETAAAQLGMAFDALNGATLARTEDGTLAEIIRQTTTKLRDLLNPALNPNSDTYGTRLTAASLQTQLFNAQRELDLRNQFRRDIAGPGGIAAARRNYDPIQFENLLRQFGPGSQDLQKQTLNELRTLNDRVRSGLTVRDISA